MCNSPAGAALSRQSGLNDELGLFVFINFSGNLFLSLARVPDAPVRLRVGDGR